MAATEHGDQIKDEFDRPVSGAQIYVYDISGNKLALTSDGSTQLDQPVISDAFGTYTYWADAPYREDVWYGGRLRYKSVIQNTLKGDTGSPGLANNAFDTRSAMAAYNPDGGLNVGDNFFLSESGREGWFVVVLKSAYTAQIAADTQQGLFVASTSDTTKAYRRNPGISTWHQITWFGVAGDGSDESAKIQAAANTVNSLAGSKVLFFPKPPSFYGCGSPLDLSQTTGLTLKAYANRVEPLTDSPACALVYSGTGSAFILAGKSHGLTLDGPAFQVSSGSFTGDIITTDNDGAGGAVTYSTDIINCFIGGRTSTARHARSLINASGAVELFIDRNVFGWADLQIIGRHSGSTQPFSNAVTITRNRFNGANNHAINVFAAEQWTIANNVFEPLYGGTSAGAISDLLVGGSSRGSHYGVVIQNNGFWDATTSGNWIDMFVQGTTVAGNYGSLGNAATFAHFYGGAGLKLSGNIVVGGAGATFITDTDVVMTQFDDDGTNVVASGITYNGNPSGFTAPDRALRDVTSRNLTATAVAGVGGVIHARKAVGTGVIGGALLFDRNDDTNWRGGAVFSWYDTGLAKECAAFAVSDSTTTPLDSSKIMALLTEDGDWKPTRKILQNATMTAGGTTGAQTINKPSGSVNFAAAATSLVVTNSLVSTSSIILCTVQTNDSTMKSVQAVAGSGSFTLYANAAATAETKVSFMVVN
jgi:hypothetical protein